MSQHEDNWLTLDEFPFVEQLEVVRGMLEAAGIECFCPDSQMSRVYANGVRARIQVRESQFDEARELLDSFEQEAANEQGPDDIDQLN